MWQQLLSNPVLITALIAWFLSGLMKVPIEYIETRKWNWALWLSPGGMPSSHSAMVTAVMLATGLYAGFNSPAFAIAFTVMMVVVYDAAGVRRQAGFHAEKINTIIEELLTGHPISDDALNEVLGHTPREVIGGVLVGLAIALVVWAFWH
jgi:acid phosphatase family membrane protein YuiD